MLRECVKLFVCASGMRTTRIDEGVEFTDVDLFGVNEDQLALQLLLRGHARAEADDVLLRERALLYAATLRVRDALMVSVVGEAS